MSGSAGLVFMDDIIKSLKDNWKSTGGKRPEFTKKWETKVVNYGGKQDKVIITLDGENPEIFSLRYEDSTYDWLHTVSVSIDVWSGFSEDRVLEMVNEIMRILKTNVLLNINNNQYVQLLPVGINPLLEDYRNIYRYMIDIEVIRLNP